MNFIYLAFNIMVNLSRLIKMLNGNKENDSSYRQRLKYTEFVVICYVLHYRMACFKKKFR